MTKVFGFWRIVLAVGWAKSLLWASTTEKEERIYLISLHIIKKKENKALGIILGPIAITIGIVL